MASRSQGTSTLKVRRALRLAALATLTDRFEQTRGRFLPSAASLPSRRRPRTRSSPSSSSRA